MSAPHRGPPNGPPVGASPSAGRLFVAVPLADAARSAIAGHLDRALGGPLPGRRVAPENWHLTLRFLGDTTARARDRLLLALGATPLGNAFDLGFTSLGAFPDPARARVVWLGTGPGAEALRHVAAIVEERAVASGFPPDTRGFRAHLTLSRLKPDADVRDLLARAPSFDVRMRAGEVRVYRSHLSPSGPRYEVVERFPLRFAQADRPAQQGAS